MKVGGTHVPVNKNLTGLKGYFLNLYARTGESGIDGAILNPILKPILKTQNVAISSLVNFPGVAFQNAAKKAGLRTLKGKILERIGQAYLSTAGMSINGPIGLIPIHIASNIGEAVGDMWSAG